VSADIPLFKINNREVRNFLLKYTQTDPPDESSLRKHYLPECYEETLNKIRVLCGKENIWVSIDETADASESKFANVVIGVLKNDQRNLSSAMQRNVCSESHNSSNNEAMQGRWPDGVKFDDMLLLVTDTAPYMKKAAEGLSVSRPELIQVACVARALHRLCETSRVLYPSADKLVANGKKIFVKSPARLELFEKSSRHTTSSNSSN
jgi:hypothetical protein